MIWLFDIDGTLIRAGGAGSLAMSRALETEFEVQPRMEVTFSGRTDYAITKDLFSLHEVRFTPANVSHFYASYLQQLPRALRECDGHILPGVTRWLEKLATANCSLGLLTGNMEAAAQIKLAHFGLARHFSFGGYGDKLLSRNDVAASALADAQLFLADKFAASRRSTWVIGDTPHDIACARSQNANAIGVATGSHSIEELSSCKPNLSLKSLHDIRIVETLIAEFSSGAKLLE